MAEKIDLDALEREANRVLGEPDLGPSEYEDQHNIIALVNRIRELERASQPGSGKADTARLDWLQTNGCTVRRADNGRRNLVIWSDGSIREAIDAARASLDGQS